jgi:transposase
MKLSTIGLDLGKNIFHVVGLDDEGAVALRKRLSRSQVLGFFGKLPPSLIGMEACCGAHWLARELVRLGHDARLIPAQYVRPYVKSQKNDTVDAEAIAEAVRRPGMHFVPIKTPEQLDLQAMHRVRERLVARRTSLVNQIRGFLVDRGVSMPLGVAALRRRLPDLLARPDDRLSSRIRSLLASQWDECCQVDDRIDAIDREIVKLAAGDEACRRLMEVPGVGPIVATALVAAVANGAAFRRSRDLSAWLGLVPQQASTGGRTKLLGITKRGNTYLRWLFVQGANTVRFNLRRERHRLGPWLDALEDRAPKNVAIIALANKLVRIAWAVLTSGGRYRASGPATA